MPKPTQYMKVHGIYQSPAFRQMEYITYWVPETPFTFDPDLINSMAAAMGAHVEDVIKPVLVDTASTLGARVYIHDGSQLYTRHILSPLPSLGGVTESDCLPDHVAVCVRYESGITGRPGNGRFFLGCVPEIWTTDNQLTGPGVTAYENFASGLLAPFTPGMGAPTFNLFHYSRKVDTMALVDYMTPHTLLKRQGRRLFRTLL